ncbi:restriction endonuclease [Actinomadura parmotrematis]|uniref:Restriction endonuclease n=1 Tax=Actinomadura parmotrematis TaxID=2864039 RepID=A0ABS7G4L3_9ACTN|nr:restriction endonuclease [Actinomadura parmotrematis]MBW8487670.1 restriction endonuclease [Actinomadura parmotrematis]
MSEYREYENGVADVLSFIFGEHAKVERNVMLPTRSGSRRRQIDVFAHISLFGVMPLKMIVDCKHHKSKTDVKVVDNFIGLVDDVGADVGILMTSSGGGAGALGRAADSRGIEVATLTIDELRSWSPMGTMDWEIRIDPSHVENATKKLRHAGFRVSAKEERDTRKIILHLLRHDGTPNPSGEVQADYRAKIDKTLAKINVTYESVSNGITIGGGTPAHRPLEVTMGGLPIGLKVIAATEAEAASQLDSLTSMGLPREALDVIRPEGWPLPGLFGLPGLPLEWLKGGAAH